MLHEARTDFSMVLSLLFLLIVGAGAISLDAMIAPRKPPPLNPPAAKPPAAPIPPEK